MHSISAGIILTFSGYKMETTEHLDELQYEKRARAGLIPYMRNERGELIFLMMVASNPKMGGAKPMISKGKIEEYETAFECAVREAQEELGLVLENIVDTPALLCKDRVVLRSGTYDLTLYYVEINERWNFDMWCDETEYTVWLTRDEFKEQGRRDHIKYIDMLYDELVRMPHR
jgi:8-oxo-dGTP pyrophosphatase MutT (NUDIX family)